MCCEGVVIGSVLLGSRRGSSLCPGVLLRALEGVRIVALLEQTPEAVAETLRAFCLESKGGPGVSGRIDDKTDAKWTIPNMGLKV